MRKNSQRLTSLLGVLRLGFRAANFSFGGVFGCGLVRTRGCRVTMVSLMVGDIEPGAFEDYGYRREDAARFALALGTGDSAFITETSPLFEPI